MDRLLVVLTVLGALSGVVLICGWVRCGALWGLHKLLHYLVCEMETIRQTRESEGQKELSGNRRRGQPPPA